MDRGMFNIQAYKAHKQGGIIAATIIKQSTERAQQIACIPQHP